MSQPGQAPEAGQVHLVTAQNPAAQASATLRPPVVIVGAGPVGLVAAILLAQYGIHSIIVERRTQPHPLPRAVHLDDESCRILQAAGVAELFTQISRPALGLRMLDARHQTMAEFSRSSTIGVHGYPQANMFDQPELEALLRARAGELPQIELRGGCQLTSLTSDPSSATVLNERDDLEQIAASAVLGCDGAASSVRGLIGASMRDLHFRERWLVVDARGRRQLGTWAGVQQVCDPARAATYMQISDDRYRWEFRLDPGEQATSLSNPRMLGALLAPWTGRDDLAGLEIIRSAEYTFRAQLASPWRRKRVFLLGDAAHETPPFIGQGLGTGLRDAANLSWKLALVVSGGADEALLDSYQDERSPHAEALIRKAVVLGWAMTGGQDRAAWVRRHVLAGLVRVPTVRTKVLDRGTPPLRHGALATHGQRDRNRLAGQLIPQPVVIAGGRQLRLDDVLGPGFSVVTLDPLSPQLERFSSRLGARVVLLQDHSATADGIWEPQQRLTRWLANGHARAVVVRPDRVVLAAADRRGQLSGDGLRAVVACAQFLHQQPGSDGPQQG